MADRAARAILLRREPARGRQQHRHRHGGEAPALTDLIAGQAELMVSTTGSSLQYARAGTVRALATTTDDPVADLADVPPLSKTVPGYRADAWSGLCAPRGTPSEIITLLNKQLNLAMANPNINKRISTLGALA